MNSFEIFSIVFVVCTNEGRSISTRKCKNVLSVANKKKFKENPYGYRNYNEFF